MLVLVWVQVHLASCWHLDLSINCLSVEGGSAGVQEVFVDELKRSVGLILRLHLVFDGGFSLDVLVVD